MIKQKTKMLSIVETDQLQKLKRIAKTRKVSVSYLIRTMIDKLKE